MRQIDAEGWCTGVRRLESPHWDERPEDVVVSLVVLHNISLPPLEFGSSCVEELFLGTLDVTKDARLAPLAGLRVSSHFFIRRTGEIVQFVSTRKRAWHAGVSTFGELSNCNHFSIGIELEGTDFTPFEDAQYEALEELLAAIDRDCHPRFLVGHSDIAPGRKTDPGPFFDWRRLYRDRERFGSPRMTGTAAVLQLGSDGIGTALG